MIADRDRSERNYDTQDENMDNMFDMRKTLIQGSQRDG